MEIGFVGLGRMGLNMVTRLGRHRHRVVAYDRDLDRVREAEAQGAVAAESLDALVERLAAPRAVWVMVPAGAPTEETVQALGSRLGAGDLVVDGGNSYYKDDARRAAELHRRGVRYVDAGTSGGVWGLEQGYCLMVGGAADDVRRLEPALAALAPPGGWAHVGPSGAGHYVKMIHNGIEYGMMQAYAEGFELLHRSDFGLDLPRIATLWGRGSVVRSWLLELLAGALGQDPALERIRGYVEDSGEGRWTILDAIEKDVPAPTITQALYTRFRSRQPESYGEKVLAALRHAFGGHAVRRAGPS